ncbi:undecaprenyldiphospho-muramoylpentapeptide beta-N-acetylglucosaminyltransferase [Neisseriaceae bacterium TC5R-5]|nr:undecaprenyldiphospho-muramoylpentapeptide beta-N-acetylglucosaminyltransferase [Neisseriaceae bacterium TC5R-5]
MTNRTVMVMAAGTGGHIVPGLAVAKELAQRGWKVVWLGTERGMENRLVPPSGIPLERLPFHGLRGKGWLGAVKGSWQLLSALVRSASLLFRHRPDVVLCMGGYICVPGGIMSGLLWKPMILVNADASLLLSNKVLLPLARKLLCGFAGSAAQQHQAKALVTGNPVRHEIETLSHPEQRFAERSGPLNILVVGGSLGAKVLNETLPAALALLDAAQRPRVSHQTGEANHASVLAAYQQAGLGEQVEVLPFIDDMPQRLASCDVIICRAGAITISELCAAGVASVLVPLVVSTTSHQRDNASWMAAAGAAIYLPQNELNASKLAQLLVELKREQLLDMAQRARALAQPGAAARVADVCEQLAG